MADFRPLPGGILFNEIKKFDFPKFLMFPSPIGDLFYLIIINDYIGGI